MSRPAPTVARIPSGACASPDGIRATVAGALPRTVARQHGFTLVELVMVIAIAGLVAVLISTVMSNPLQSFVDQSRRAELVDKASMALNRMARDIRLAVPNSVRPADVDSDTLELLRGPVGGRYRANLVGGVRQDPPVCDSNPCLIPVPGPLDLSLVDLSGPLWMVIYNVGSTGAGNTIWLPLDSAQSVISPPVNVAAAAVPMLPIGTEPGISLTGAGIDDFRFKYASPQHRFYLADKVVGYRCIDRKLLRGEFTELKLANPYDYSNAATVVDNVDCDKSKTSFTYAPGTNTRSGLVTIRLTLNQAGETITLLQQVHVDNAP